MKRRFTVTWSQPLLDDYTEHWASSSGEERRNLTTIADRVDRELSIAGDRLGQATTSEPRYRVWEIPGVPPPAVVTYEVSPDDLMVTVLRLTVISSR